MAGSCSNRIRSNIYSKFCKNVALKRQIGSHLSRLFFTRGNKIMYRKKVEYLFFFVTEVATRALYY